MPKLGGIGRKDDPLLRAANEKKIKQYRDQKEKEIQQQLELIRLEGENRKKEVEKYYQKRIKELAFDFEKKQAKEEDRIRSENKPMDDKFFQSELKKGEVEIKRELEAAVNQRMTSLDDELKYKLDEVKENMIEKKQSKQKEIIEQAEQEFKEDIEKLDKEINKLKKPDRARLEEELSALEQRKMRNIREDKEKALESEKEKITKAFKDETNKKKEVIFEKHRADVSELCNDLDSSNLADQVLISSKCLYKLIIN